MGKKTGPTLVEIGVCGRPHGLRGEVYLQVHAPDSKAFSAADQVYIGDSYSPRRILSSEPHKRGFRVRFEGVSDRSDADSLCGQKVYARRDTLPRPQPDEYYDVDLVGLHASDGAGEKIGTVVAVEHPPANDVLVIRLLSDEYVDVPMIAAFIVDVRLDQGEILVDMPDGLPTRQRQ